ncbi:MAG TPA: hypothetical protein VF622_11165 [Segetibacter sp.]|jgi:hypothetical protein
MKKILSTIAFYCICSIGISQQIDTTIKLDLLKAPVSPAFNLLGIASNEVERPTDVTSFALSLQNASNNFSAIPKSYAIEIAPFLLGTKKFILNDFDKKENVFKQSFLLSGGFTHKGPEGKEEVDSLKTVKLGMGTKFSIIRPKWSQDTRSKYNNLIEAQKQVLQDYKRFEKHNKNYALWLSKRMERKEVELNKNLDATTRSQRIAALKIEIAGLDSLINLDANDKLRISSEAFQQTKEIASNFKAERKGLFLDFSGGFALDFPANQFTKGRAYKAGTWLTGGYESGNKGITSMFILRYLYNPETIFADPNNLLKSENYSTFDAGGRILFNADRGKLTFSTEGIYRSILKSDQLEPSWRFVLNTEYSIGMNRVLTFSFGRDFDGTISKGGNLIAAINFITGFGSERKISNQ